MSSESLCLIPLVPFPYACAYCRSQQTPLPLSLSLPSFFPSIPSSFPAPLLFPVPCSFLLVPCPMRNFMTNPSISPPTLHVLSFLCVSVCPLALPAFRALLASAVCPPRSTPPLLAVSFRCVRRLCKISNIHLPIRLFRSLRCFEFYFSSYFSLYFLLIFSHYLRSSYSSYSICRRRILTASKRLADNNMVHAKR